MRQAMDTAWRQDLQKDLRTLTANIRADAEGEYDSAEPGWRAVEWTLLWIENIAGQLTEGRSSRQDSIGVHAAPVMMAAWRGGPGRHATGWVAPRSPAAAAPPIPPRPFLSLQPGTWAKRG
jgi:hypothetical protein